MNRVMSFVFGAGLLLLPLAGMASEVPPMPEWLGWLGNSDVAYLLFLIALLGLLVEIASPGMMKRHYAPKAKLRLNAKTPEPDEAYLAFGPSKAPADANLSPSGDLLEAAANLFAMLRELDDTHTRIAVAPIPTEGLGEAINDRLKRAASS